MKRRRGPAGGAGREPAAGEFNSGLNSLIIAGLIRFEATPRAVNSLIIGFDQFAPVGPAGGAGREPAAGGGARGRAPSNIN